MTTELVTAPAGPPVGALGSRWVLTVPLDGGRLAGAPVARADHLELFFSGYLVNPPRGAEAASSLSDAEAVLSLVVREGESALTRLRGSFVLALADRRAGRTIVGRDPLGFHPLYYAETSDAVLFAPSALSLTGLPGISTDVNTAVLADHLCHRWSQSPSETYLKSVHRLQPGCRAVLSSGRMRTERVWSPMPEGQPIRWASEDEVQTFPTLFERAIDRCLSLGHPGIFLSGGLDSISIAVLAADRSRSTGRALPHALSLGFSTPETDERREQTEVAAALGMPQCLLQFEEVIGRAGLLAPALELNQHLSSPLLNRWEPAYSALARRGRELGVETVLAGSGGDEWLTVTPMLAADLLRKGDVWQFASIVRAWQRSFHHPRWRLYRNALWRFGLRPILSQRLRRVWPDAWLRNRMTNFQAAAPRWVAPDSDVRRAQDERLEALIQAPPPADGFYVQELRESLHHPLVSLEREERFEFARINKVRYAYPFWDPDLVDLLMRTPPRLLNRSGRSKGLVRETVARRMPGLSLDRQVKRTGTTFSRVLLAREAPALMKRLGPPTALGDLGVVDPHGAWTFANDAVARGGQELYRVWDLLNLESWVRTRVH